MANFRLRDLEAIRARHPQYAGIRVFVETGTFHAKTTLLARSVFPVVHSIELSRPLYDQAVREHGATPDLHFHLGDSRVVLPPLCQRIAEPAVFYLDAHWFQSREVAGRGDPAGFPLWDELRAVATRRYHDLVLVDDVHDFGTPRPRPEWQNVSLQKIAARLPGHLDAAVMRDQAVVWR